MTAPELVGAHRRISFDVRHKKTRLAADYKLMVWLLVMRG
jgi:hypothetical protein